MFLVGTSQQAQEPCVSDPLCLTHVIVLAQDRLWSFAAVDSQAQAASTLGFRHCHRVNLTQSGVEQLVSLQCLRL